MLYRHFLAMETEELLRSHPVDGAVLMGGCDKTTPGLLMGAISADLPTIFLPAGPMLAGRHGRERLGSGTDVWKYWAERQAGCLDACVWRQLEEGIARSAGFPDPAIATEAFRLKPLVAGEPADVGLAAMSGGRYALVVATAVKSGDLSQFSPQIRTQLRDQLARLRAETERQAFVKALRDQFEVTVAEERL